MMEFFTPHLSNGTFTTVIRNSVLIGSEKFGFLFLVFHTRLL